MKPAYAVIGAGYGDEGKGLTVDFLTRQLTVNGEVPLVARGNGGAQAGHTVVTTDGKRHVFGHVGAGTFAGAETYLARNFIINPYVLEKELNEVRLSPNNVQVHAACRVSTIFDMALNSLREMSRGAQRHGSCGLGINETVNRHDAGYELTFYDLICSSTVANAIKLNRIFDEYWYPQFKQLQSLVGRDAEDFVNVFVGDKEDTIVKVADKLSILKKLRCAHPYDPPSVPLIAEGAQGLMLDEHLGNFPHVTRSITGLPSALLAAHELGYREINPVYVTRAYATRHGAGKLHSEGEPITDQQLPDDKTNVTGPWQGHFRRAPLSIASISAFIQLDLNRSQEVAKTLGIKVNRPCIMLTCMDQLGTEVVTRRHGGKIEWSEARELPNLLEKETGIQVKWVSYGETAQDVIAR